MYDILLSIKPYWAYLIMKGLKPVEVRKFYIKDPNWSGKFKCYVSKDKTSLKRIPEADRAEFEKYLGKVAFEFVKGGVEEFRTAVVPYYATDNLGYERFIDNGVYKAKSSGVVFERPDKYIDTMLKNEDLAEMCLSSDELLNYIDFGKKGYGYRVTALKVYDKTKELGEFYRCSDGKCQSYNCKSKYCGIGIECGNLEQLTRPPQNYIKIMEV